jgi:hypothetical protein
MRQTIIISIATAGDEGAVKARTRRYLFLRHGRLNS